MKTLSRRVGIIFRLLALALLIISASPVIVLGSQSVAVTQWTDAQWNHTDSANGNGGYSVVSAQSGGPTGNYWLVHNRVNSWSPAGLYGSTSTNTAQCIYTNFTYNPATSGPIVAIKFSMLFSSAQQGISFLVRQSGRTYYCSVPYIATGPGGWQTLRATAQAENFNEGGLNGGVGGVDVDATSHPDFSATGAPMTFGFSGGNTTGYYGEGYDTYEQYTDFAVDVCTSGSIFVAEDWNSNLWSQFDVLWGAPGGGGESDDQSSSGLFNSGMQVYNLVYAWYPGYPDTSSSISGYRVFTSRYYVPSAQGQLNSVTMSIDASGWTQGFDFCLRQNGKWYAANWGSLTPASWDSLSATFAAQDFVEIDNHFNTYPENHPDFTSSGSKIEFGFATANGNGPYPSTGSYSTTVYYDNFLVCIDSPGQPDNTPPSLIITPNDGVWHNSDVTVTISAVDETGGSGLKNISYSANGAQSIGATTSTSSPVSMTISTEGTTIVAATAADNATNQASASATIKLDKTPPHTTAQMTASGKNVQVTLSASDSLSGVAQTYYQIGSTTSVYATPFVVAPGTSVSFWSVDRAGNIETANSASALLRVIITLIDSHNTPLAGGTVQYYASGWQNVGTTDANGIVTVGLAPGSYAFAITYKGGRIQKNQDVSTNPSVVFQTVNVTVKLVDSFGNPLANGAAQFYAGAWQNMGTTGTDGTVSMQMLPASYAFSLDFRGGRTQKNQDVSSNVPVQFQTARVHSSSGTCTQYYGGGWNTFMSDMELLAVSYTFRFSDGTSNTAYTITGPVTNIH